MSPMKFEHAKKYFMNQLTDFSYIEFPKSWTEVNWELDFRYKYYENNFYVPTFC